MKNRLLMAMSTLGGNQINGKNEKFEISFNDEMEIVDKCVSQLEPTSKYMLDQMSESLEILILCTDKTLREDKNIVGEAKAHTAVSYFVYRILKHIEPNNNEINVEQFMSSNIKTDTNYDCGKVIFRFIEIDENAPKVGIEKVIEYIKQNREINKFWIDTHGGFRDTAFILNAVVSLLKVYGIYPDKIVGVRYADDKKQDENINKVIDQGKSFKMFDFVSGMNEFIQFGSADSLVEYFKENKEPSIKLLIDAMKTISDGTRLCDPTLYITGLDMLENCIDKIQSDDEFITVFVDYIKKDYEGLLNNKNSRNLEIIKRCYDKKLYQQALTFIESLMPEEYVRKHILYYDMNDNNVFRVIGDMKDKSNKNYISDAHFVFDSYLFSLAKYYNNEEKDWELKDKNDRKQIELIINKALYGRNLNNEKIKKIKSDLKRDFKAIRAINDKSDDIITAFFVDRKKIVVTNNREEIGNMEIFTDVNTNNTKKVGKLLRLHKALKQCRNLTNHAAEKFRPTIVDISAGIKLYIDLAEVVFDDNSLIKRAEPLKSAGFTKLINNNNSSKQKKKKDTKNRDSRNVPLNGIGTMPIKKGVVHMGEKDKDKYPFQVKFANGEMAVIDIKNASGIKNDVIGKEINVIIEKKIQGISVCKPINI